MGNSVAGVVDLGDLVILVVDPGLVEVDGAVTLADVGLPVAGGIVAELFLRFGDGADQGAVDVQVAPGEVAELIEPVVVVGFVLAGSRYQIFTPGTIGSAVVAVLDVIEFCIADRFAPLHIHGAAEPVEADVIVSGVADRLSSDFDVAEFHAGSGYSIFGYQSSPA